MLSARGWNNPALTNAVVSAYVHEPASTRPKKKRSPAQRLIHERQSTDQEGADAAARANFSFTDERAGLLVKKVPDNTGFLHLSLQEYLSARHLMQRSLAEKICFVSGNAGRIRWREPILYLLL